LSSSTHILPSVTKELGEYSLFRPTPIALVNDDESKSIAIIAGNYNIDEDGWVKDLILFLDIYSLDGNLIKRTELLDEPRSIQLGAINLAAGDMNNDGNLEIFSSVYLFYKDLYFNDIEDINTFETLFFILDINGDKVSKLNPIKGYAAEGLIFADLQGNNNLTAITMLSDTIPTTYDGQKIVAFDYDGNIIFDTNLDDFNNLMIGIVAGDVDSDGEVEIIANYRPRFWGGRHSGVQIFNKDGVLEKDIKIPTMGMVDIYRSSPILTDFNNDGKVDIILQSSFLNEKFEETFRLYAVSLGSSYNPETMEWPMFQRDPQHTGSYNYNSKIIPQFENPQSKIINNASINARGNLAMKLQKRIADSWINKQIVANNKQIEIPANNYYDLTTDWNSQNTIANEVGDYRVYASFNYGTDSVEASWEFKVI